MDGNSSKMNGMPQKNNNNTKSDNGSDKDIDNLPSCRVVGCKLTGKHDHEETSSKDSTARVAKPKAFPEMSTTDGPRVLKRQRTVIDGGDDDEDEEDVDSDEQGDDLTFVDTEEFERAAESTKLCKRRKKRWDEEEMEDQDETESTPSIPGWPTKEEMSRHLRSSAHLYGVEDLHVKPRKIMKAFRVLHAEGLSRSILSIVEGTQGGGDTNDKLLQEHNKSYPDVYPRDGSLLFEMRYFNAGGEGKSVFITDIRRAAILLADTQYVKAEICRRVPNLCKEWNQLNSAPEKCRHRVSPSRTFKIRSCSQEGSKGAIYNIVVNLITYNYTMLVNNTPGRVTISPDRVMIGIRYHSTAFKGIKMRKGFYMAPIVKVIQLLDSKEAIMMRQELENILAIQKENAEKQYRKLTRVTFDL